MAQTVKDFENYDVTSLDYDKIRHAVGVEVILGALSFATRKSPKELRVLDAGCGTGNYLAALSEFVGKMTGVEQNEGMLEQSRQKTAHLANVEIFQGNILSLPFPDQQFDGVVCNQVIHHLQPEGSNDFHNIGHFLREVYRVLKTNGALILNFNTPEQACTSNWFLQLFSEQLQEKYAKKCPSLPVLQKLMQDAGFKLGPALSLTHENLYKPHMFYNKEGPFLQEWRNGDSTWAVLSPEQLEKTLTNWRKTIDEGKADDFIGKCEEHRMRIGCSTSAVGYK